jgi:hypothetical protein
LEADLNADDMKISGKGRRLRLQLTLEEIKKNKTMTRDDALRYIMRKWILSRRIAEIYVNELTDLGQIKIIEKPDGDWIEYVEGE